MNSNHHHVSEILVEKRWVGGRIVAATCVLLVTMLTALAVQYVAVSSYIKETVSATRVEYDLATLPKTFDALNHPVRRISIETSEIDYSMNIVATKRFNTSYMELYSENSVVIHVDVDVGISLSLPMSDVYSETPYVRSLLDLAEPGDNVAEAISTYTPETGVAVDVQNRRNLALRIGRFYLCIFCKGSWRCSGTIRRRRWRGGCRRLIAIGFDAER